MFFCRKIWFKMDQKELKMNGYPPSICVKVFSKKMGRLGWLGGIPPPFAKKNPLKVFEWLPRKWERKNSTNVLTAFYFPGRDSWLWQCFTTIIDLQSWNWNMPMHFGLLRVLATFCLNFMPSISAVSGGAQVWFKSWPARLQNWSFQPTWFS